MTYDIAVHWIKERESIRIRKESNAPYPWTDDPILRDYRFCCVRREDDRVTKWIDANVRRPFQNNPNLWLMLCVCRIVNWPDTLAELISTPRAFPIDDGFDPMILASTMIARAGKVFTGAYIIPSGNGKFTTKADYVGTILIGKLWGHRTAFIRIPRTLRDVHAFIAGHDGWGPFLAYQSVVDMRFTPILSGAPDIATWAAAGPGTIRGLNRLAGRRLDFPLDQGRALGEIRDLHPRLVADSGVAMDFSDVPNVMCEVDKYIRVMKGEGKPRARYVPGRGS